jgi:hypothetical protein
MRRATSAAVVAWIAERVVRSMTASRREKLDARCVTPSGPGDRVDELAAGFDVFRVLLPTLLGPRWHRRLEDGSRVVAGGDGLAGESVVQ